MGGDHEDFHINRDLKSESLAGAKVGSIQAFLPACLQVENVKWAKHNLLQRFAMYHGF